MEVKVIYDYTARHSGELSIQKGNVIKYVRKLTDGWYEGTLHGKTGVFPGNYVEHLGQSSSHLRNVGKPGNITRDSAKPINSQGNFDADNPILNEVRKVQLRKVESAGIMTNAATRKSFKAPRSANASNRQDFSKANTVSGRFNKPSLSPIPKPTSKPERIRPKIPDFSPPQNKGLTFDRAAPTNPPDKNIVLNRFSTMMTDRHRETRVGSPPKVKAMPEIGSSIVNGANYPSNVAYNSNRDILSAGTTMRKKSQPSLNFGSHFQTSSGKSLNSPRPYGAPPPPPPPPIFQPTSSSKSKTSTAKVASYLTEETQNRNSSTLGSGTTMKNAQQLSNFDNRFQNNSGKTLNSPRPNGGPPPPPPPPIFKPTSSRMRTTSTDKATSNLSVETQNRNELLDSIKGFKKDRLKKVSATQGKKGRSNDLVDSLMKSKLLQRNASYNGDKRNGNERGGPAWS